MRLSSFLGAFLLLAGTATAQSHPTYPRKTTEYIGKFGQKLPGPEGAHHRIDRTFRDSLSGNERIYNAAGKLLEITPYADMVHLIKLGPRTTYFETGQLHTKDDYVGAKRNGEFLVYYPEGQLKRREIYVADERKSEACFAKDGSAVPYYPYEVMPVFERGGNEEIVRAIQLNTHYPVQALRNQEQGQVFVSFDVSEVGKVENVRIVKGVSASLDAETIAAVDKLKLFTPGRLDGEPVSVSFTLPITYMIR